VRAVVIALNASHAAQMRDSMGIASPARPSGSDGDLAGVVQHDVERQLDDVAAVRAGVGVVGLDDVPEQQRGAPIGLRQLECVVETPPPLAGEDREDTAERQQAKRRQRLPAGRNGEREAHRREEHVDEVDALTSFRDPRPYFLAPGGRFEDRGTAGWRLSGNAQYNNPGSPYALFSASDIEALRLQPGGSATSPAFCVDVDYPSLRFFLADFEARGAELEVEVIYPDMAGDKCSSPPG
jgi:hypothetical protein